MEYTLKQAVSVAIKCGREYKKKLANTKMEDIFRVPDYWRILEILQKSRRKFWRFFKRN